MTQSREQNFCDKCGCPIEGKALWHQDYPLHRSCLIEVLQEEEDQSNDDT